jgi:hypothetical protein
MGERPNLSPEHFEILVVRELRKSGLDVSALSLHRRVTLPDDERGYVLELKGAVGAPGGARPALIACLQLARTIGASDVAACAAHLHEADLELGLLFGASDFDRGAVQAGEAHGIALFRVVDGRTAFDTSGWGAPGHYPAWLPAYCAQSVGRDPLGEPQYTLLESGRGAGLVSRLGNAASPAAEPRRSGGGPRA